MKTKFRFPVAKGRRVFFPKEALCPVCKAAKVLEPHSMAIINLGAILMTNRETGSGTMSDDLDGFLRLIWHGAHDGGLGRDSGVDAHVEIVQDVRGGQADLYFCSTGCLREFLNACVDELERTIAEAKSREDLNNRIQSNTR